jgi:hypothetical protein
MRHRTLATIAGTLLLIAVAAPAAAAGTGVGLAPDQDAAGRGFGPTTDRGPSGPQALKAAKAPAGEAGAPGIGDPYVPLEGNGGYDVRHYDLSFSYDPVSGQDLGAFFQTWLYTAGKPTTW